MTTTKTAIKLHNTKTRTKETFVPIDDKNVRMYVCGPTVYDRAHLGNARPVVVFDVLYRLLRHVYGADHVTYVRNFTDVDDKINARAAKNVGPKGDVDAEIVKLTNETTQWFLDDMAAVGALEPDHMPRATAYVPQMVAMIETLIAKGYAYPANGHVLFRVREYADYGKLSGRSVDDMIAGARVEIAPYKEDPMDFVLWKPSTDDLPGWDSPWGRGRPGWHIECSAMAEELLWKHPLARGQLSENALNHPHTFDIHGGGNDLTFPHHENEIAQSCCANETNSFANVWLHNEMLQVEGKKMSKSLGNFFTVRELLEQGVSGEVIRFVLLSTHYRKPMDWTEKKAHQAEATLRHWWGLVDGVDAMGADQAIVDAIANDLNTSAAITRLHAMAKDIAANPQKDCFYEKGTFLGSAQMMGLLNQELGGWARSVDLSVYSKRLSDLRRTAMETKNFAEVDAMKAALIGAGIEVRMSKDGVDLTLGAGFAPEKLEALK